MSSMNASSTSGWIVARQAAFLLRAARVPPCSTVGPHDFLGELLPAEREVTRVDDFEILEHAERRRAGAEVDDGDELVGAASGIWCVKSWTRVLDGERLDVDDRGLQSGRLDGDLALLDVLGRGSRRAARRPCRDRARYRR
jgi:hypothetical protein